MSGLLASHKPLTSRGYTASLATDSVWQPRVGIGGEAEVTSLSYSIFAVIFFLSVITRFSIRTQ